MSILLYGWTTWMLTKCMEKKLDSNYTRMLQAILNKSWKQHPTKQQLYGPLPPITKTIKIRRNRHAGHCWRSRDKIISDVLLWTSSHGWAKAGQPAGTSIERGGEKGSGISAQMEFLKSCFFASVSNIWNYLTVFKQMINIW